MTACKITFKDYTIQCSTHNTYFDTSHFTDQEQQNGFNITCPKNPNDKKHVYIDYVTGPYNYPCHDILNGHFDNATSLTLYQG